MSDILEYKCPCCGGAIEFNSSIQKMKCPYCDTEFELDTLKEFEEEDKKEANDPQWDAENVQQSREEIGDDGTLKTYVCDSCGGEIIADATTGATSCPYCGNPVVVPKQFSGMLRPDLIIPFKLDKKQAEQKLKEHLKGKVLLPKMFRRENRIKEVKGIYVPFWLYTSDADAEIHCRATKVRRWTSGDYEYTETKHFLVTRSGQIGFDNVPADGSEKMANDLMESIEPFQYEAAVPFEKAYLAGYLADKYDVSSEECAKRANQRMQKCTERSFMDTINGYTTCVPEKTDIQLRQGKISYALLPVWVLSTKYKGEILTFAMNGQTGKFVGNLPMDNGKVWRIFGGVFAAVFLLTFLITGLF